MHISLPFFMSLSRLIKPITRYQQLRLHKPISFEKDYKSLKKDWQTVGRDFTKVLNNYGRK